MLSHFRPRVTYANVTATVALLLALGGGALAAARFVGSGGQIRGCVSKKGKLVLIKPGKSCKKGQTEIAWNQKGLRGKPGPSTGPAGGDLTGHYPAPTIGLGKVTASKLAPAESWHEVAVNESFSGTPDPCPSTTGAFCGSFDQCGANKVDCPWYNFERGYETAGFYKDPYGLVHLRGTVGGFANVTGAVPAAKIFVLPPGYRPPATAVFIVFEDDKAARVDVDADGSVAPVPTPSSNAPVFLSLAGISFRAG